MSDRLASRRGYRRQRRGTRRRNVCRHVSMPNSCPLILIKRGRTVPPGRSVTRF